MQLLRPESPQMPGQLARMWPARQAQQLALMSAAHRPAHNNLIALGDHVFDDALEIREGSAEHASGLFDTRRPTWEAGTGAVVIDVVRSEIERNTGLLHLSHRC